MLVKVPAPKRFMLVKFNDLERSAWYLFEVCDDGEIRVSYFSPTDRRMEFGVKVPAPEARETWQWLTTESKIPWTLWE